MSIENVREILYRILTADEDDSRPESVVPEIVAKQQMGVNVSSAVTKNGGVKIFQLQNVVQKKVVHHVVDALKVLDTMPLLQYEQPKAIDVGTEEWEGVVEKTVDDVIKEALDEGMTYSDFLNVIGKQFIFAAIARHNTHKETAAAIKVSYSKLMQVKRTVS